MEAMAEMALILAAARRAVVVAGEVVVVMARPGHPVRVGLGDCMVVAEIGRAHV